MTQWKVSDVVEAAQALDKIPCPDVDRFNPQVKTYGETGFAFGLDGFINEHPAWVDRKGHGYFQAKLNLDEPMKLQVLMGYDGPFKLWLDGESFFTDMNGVNPCVPDKAKKVVELRKGSHDLVVGMDLVGGRSWGFFLRFKRLEVSQSKLRSGKFVKLGYLV